MKQATKSELGIEPFEDRVLVEPEEAEGVTKGGIHLPDSVKERERPQKGKVVAVGPGKNDRPMKAQVGDTVLFTRYAGSPIEHNGKKLLMLSEAEVLGRYT